MGASVTKLGGSSKNPYPDNAEINVVPFVDVMLVLLIIFMVAAPLATVNLQVDLPPANDTPPPQIVEPIFVSLQKTGQIFLGENETSMERLAADVYAKTKGDYETRIMVRADRDVVYGNVMRVMNIIQDGGFNKVALIAEEVVGL